MNSKQRACLFVGAAMVVGFGLFPPTYVELKTGVREPMGHVFIFNRPSHAISKDGKTKSRMDIFLEELSGPGHLERKAKDTRIDILRLLVLWGVGAVVAGSGVAFFRTVEDGNAEAQIQSS